jgi:phospholipase/carboxylesterase
MLALDTALHLPESIGGLVLFSGTLLSEVEWGRLAPRLHGVPVLLSHGRQDPLLSFPLAESLRDLLSQAGLAVDWFPFDGPHTIPAPAVHRCTRLLRTIGAPSR